jgi:hypothetical protein
MNSSAPLGERSLLCQSRIDILPHLAENKANCPRDPPSPHTRPCYSHGGMEHTSDIAPLTTVQQCVVNALAAGSTLTDAAETYGVHRVTVYRWMKTCQPFSAALHRARAEFVLARRDDLHKLSNRALETLLAILDNPKSSPAVLLRTSMFILQRPQLPKTGWSMPEPAPDPDGKKLLDSAIIEQDYDSLPGLGSIERDMPAVDPVETEANAESAASEPPSPAESPLDPVQGDENRQKSTLSTPFSTCRRVATPASQYLGRSNRGDGVLNRFGGTCVSLAWDGLWGGRPRLRRVSGPAQRHRFACKSVLEVCPTGMLPKPLSTPCARFNFWERSPPIRDWFPP